MEDRKTCLAAESDIVLMAAECGKERKPPACPRTVVTNEWTATVNRRIHLVAQMPLTKRLLKLRLAGTGHYLDRWLMEFQISPTRPHLCVTHRIARDPAHKLKHHLESTFPRSLKSRYASGAPGLSKSREQIIDR